MSFEKFLFYDIESCNGRIYGASMCSFGYCLTDLEFNIIEQKDILMNPLPDRFGLRDGRGEKCIQLAYEESVFRNSPTFDGVYEDIKTLFENSLAVGFSIGNDINYLNNACDEFKLKRIEYKFCDVQQIASRYFQENNQMALKKVADTLEIDYVEHRSDDDAKATFEVLKKICQKKSMNFLELKNEYKIEYGQNDAIDITNSTTDISKQVALSTKKSKNILIHEFMESVIPMEELKQPSYFTGKNVLIDGEIEQNDINQVRCAIQKLVNQGARSVHSSKYCDVFVTNDNEAKKDKILLKRNVEILSESVFFEKLGELPVLVFDDWKILQGHKKKVKRERYRRLAKEQRETVAVDVQHAVEKV